MTKFLVADDEPQIRRGLKGLLSQILDGEEFELFEAEDGVDAFEKARALSPDVLLLDIHMPRLKGLDLVERLNGLGRDWIILIVTGHDEFEYARTALTLRVFDFLLKPVPEARFREVIAKARSELATRREERGFVDWSKSRMAQQRGELRESLLRDWIEGRTPQDEFDRAARYLDLELPARPALLLVAGSGEAKSDWVRTERGRLFTPVRQTALAFAGSVAFEDTSRNIVLVVDREAAGWRDVADLLVETLGADAAPVEGLDLETIAELPAAWTRLAGLLSGKSGEGGLVSGAREFLETYYRDPELSLESTAGNLRVSPDYLSRLLKAATGHSFLNFLCRLRMEKAKVLLDDPRLRVAEIAERVGYRDQNYFCRHFKSVTGVTPKGWRSRRGTP